MGEGSPRGRPTGTVSFLFTDIEGSTPLWERHPKAMRAALERHDRILRAAIEAHGGFVFSTAGDAFSAAFWTPGDAVAAALDAQRALQVEPWADEAPVRVRMGVHLGTVHERDGDYFGAAVNRAARLMGLAHGGQVLISLAVEELVRDDLADGVGLKGLGEHGLRGLSRPETVFQLTAPEIPDEFPALSPATTVPGNLPSPPTSFVGRVEETKRLAVEIPAHRLVTLVGPGGVGKTRLAIEAGASVSDEFADGVWFVELAPVAGPDAVVHAVASTLSVSPEAGSSLLESIVDSLSGRRVLVVVDNCEHVIDAAAEIAAAVSAAAPRATILATSREPLGVAGEQVWNVSVLDVEVEAVELFCERARSVDQRFEPSDDDLAMIGRICGQLDGMPLAIELAASRVRSMSLAQLADRLADRFRLLRSPARGVAVERQVTLWATVEWSHRLLSSDERVLFDRLSVFAGSFDLDAAEAVCGFGPIDELGVFDLLSSLVDKSLVLVDRDAGRYRLLETLRQYGAEQLAERGEVDELGGRHLTRYVEVAERAREWFEGTRNREGRELFEVEWDNLRSGIEWALAVRDSFSACAIVGASDYFAMMTPRREHADWARRVLADLDATAVVWGAAGWWALDDGDAAAAVRFGEAGLRAAPSSLHPSTVRCWRSITSAHLFSFRGREGGEAARNWADAAAAASPYDAAAAAAHQGLAVARRDPTAAAAFIDVARGVVRRLDNNLSLECWVEFVAGLVEFGAGRYDSSTAVQTRVVAMSEQSGCRTIAGVAAGALAMCAVESGTTSAELWIDTLSRLRAINSWGYLWAGIEAVALNWVSAGRTVLASVVLGHLDEHDRRFPTLASRRNAALDALSSEQELREAARRGARMDRDELVEFVLDELETNRPTN